MCGLGGWYCWGDKRPYVNTIKSMLVANQLRGTDAAGVAFHDPEINTIRVIKNKGPAVKLIEDITDDVWTRIAASPRGMVHTRAKTQGPVEDNENNHPVVYRNWVVTHNGQISNDDDWFAYLNTPRFAAVDTAAIPLVLDQGTSYLSSLRQLTMLGGSLTAGIWNTAEPTKIALARFGHNNLYLFMDTDGGILYWSSAGIIGKRMPYLKMGSLRFLTMSQLPDDRIMVLAPDMDVKVYKLKRSPFFYKGKEVTTAPSGNAATKASSTPITAGGARTRAAVRYRWEKLDADEHKFKPAPQFDSKHMTWDHCDYNRLHAQASKVVNSTSTLQTAYGRWLMENRQGKLFMTYRPNRSVKRFLKKITGDGFLPPPRPNGTHLYDNQVHLENLVLVDLLPGTAQQYHSQGFVCPWCGIWARQQFWAGRSFRCNFCAIQSLREVREGGAI